MKRMALLKLLWLLMSKSTWETRNPCYLFLPSCFLAVPVAGFTVLMLVNTRMCGSELPEALPGALTSPPLLSACSLLTGTVYMVCETSRSEG